MRSSSAAVVASALLLSSPVAGFNNAGEQDPINPAIDPLKYKAACPDYKNYAMRPQYVWKFPPQLSVLTVIQPTVWHRPA